MVERDREALGEAAYRALWDPQPPGEGDACEEHRPFTEGPVGGLVGGRTVMRWCELAAGHEGAHAATTESGGFVRWQT